MGIPDSGSQLVILLLFVIPGSVYQVARSRLRGPSPADQDATSRILRAIAVSAFLNAAYLALFGPSLWRLFRGPSTLRDLMHVRWAGAWGLALLFLVPLCLALLDYWRIQVQFLARVRQRIPLLPSMRVAYDPTPRGWDFAFGGREPCFVRVLTGDGRWVGGWFGYDSFAASYPEPLEIYVEEAWLLDDQGAFLEAQASSGGLFVRCEDARVVEFVRPVER